MYFNANREATFEFQWTVTENVVDEMKLNGSIESPIFATIWNGTRCHWQFQIVWNGQRKMSIGLRLAEGGLEEIDAVKMVLETLRTKTCQFRNLGSEFMFLNVDASICSDILKVQLKINESVFGPMEFTKPKYQLCPHWKLIPLYKQTVLGEKTEDDDESKGDFTLIAAEGKRLNCHKYILKESSPVFKAMLKPHTVESKSGEASITDTSLSTLQKLLYYFYIDNLPEDWDKEGVLELLLAAHKYQVGKALEFFCERALAADLRPNNAVELLNVGLELNKKILTIKATQFIIENWARIPLEDKNCLQHKKRLQNDENSAYMVVMDAACMPKAVLKEI